MIVNVYNNVGFVAMAQVYWVKERQMSFPSALLSPNISTELCRGKWTSSFIQVQRKCNKHLTEYLIPQTVTYVYYLY